MVNKEVDINGKLDKCSINLLSSIFWSVLFWVYLLTVSMGSISQWNTVGVSLSAFLGT